PPSTVVAFGPPAWPSAWLSRRSRLDPAEAQGAGVATFGGGSPVAHGTPRGLSTSSTRIQRSDVMRYAPGDTTGFRSSLTMNVPHPARDIIGLLVGCRALR